ncbi:twin-arginine translocase TatA/TatE family subunit [Dehalogenimonas formicexedens]|uniref:Sec-independent protein translocase protein TatA n=2 Tax=Dehalogenimonas TaxID=670486 RepID=A0A1P8F9F4_9CHLR|nr:twin-arginine translocase TatA/TatE family subunit [Dehalogenimonas formicexedens]APV45075.1 sec-independent protein translocase protein TatA [Dehalogenimonas formicexedens]
MPFRLGPLELCIILVIILLIFGVGKLPQVGEAIGKSLKSFRDGSSGEDEEKPKEVKSATITGTPEAVVSKTEDTPKA